MWQGKGDWQMSELAKHDGRARVMGGQQGLKNPVINNEYAWLWLNRDGTPTCLTQEIYKKLLGPESTTAQRRLLYARYLAALTEFWRGRRQCAGVLHFCGLGYSRSGEKPRPEGGATSDHFIDMRALKLEPNFEKYVKDAFAPVGLMIDFWEESLPAGSTREVLVRVTNDLPRGVACKVSLRLEAAKKTVFSKTQKCEASAWGQAAARFSLEFPGEPGEYTLTAKLQCPGQRAVRSLRVIQVTRKE
jgi:hypothetical protein